MHAEAIESFSSLSPNRACDFYVFLSEADFSISNFTSEHACKLAWNVEIALRMTSQQEDIGNGGWTVCVCSGRKRKGLKKVI